MANAYALTINDVQINADPVLLFQITVLFYDPILNIQETRGCQISMSPDVTPVQMKAAFVVGVQECKQQYFPQMTLADNDIVLFSFQRG